MKRHSKFIAASGLALLQLSSASFAATTTIAGDYAGPVTGDGATIANKLVRITVSATGTYTGVVVDGKTAQRTGIRGTVTVGTNDEASIAIPGVTEAVTVGVGKDLLPTVPLTATYAYKLQAGDGSTLTLENVFPENARLRTHFLTRLNALKLQDKLHAFEAALQPDYNDAGTAELPAPNPTTPGQTITLSAFLQLIDDKEEEIDEKRDEIYFAPQAEKAALRVELNALAADRSLLISKLNAALKTALTSAERSLYASLRNIHDRVEILEREYNAHNNKEVAINNLYATIEPATGTGVRLYGIRADGAAFSYSGPCFDNTGVAAQGFVSSVGGEVVSLLGGEYSLYLKTGESKGNQLTPANSNSVPALSTVTAVYGLVAVPVNGLPNSGYEEQAMGFGRDAAGTLRFGFNSGIAPDTVFTPSRVKVGYRNGRLIGSAENGDRWVGVLMNQGDPGQNLIHLHLYDGSGNRALQECSIGQLN